eukprot:g9135.t1
MAESSSSGLLRSLIKDSGTCAGNPGFREWKLKLREAIDFHSSELLSVLNGTERPTETATSMEVVAAWDKANSRLYSLLFFATTGPAQQTVRTQAGKEANSTGNGAAAWKALNARFDTHTQEARRACHRDLFNLKHNAWQDPIDFFTRVGTCGLRLKVLGEEVSDDVYLDIMLSGLTEAPEFKFIREMHYRSEFTSVDRLQETANRFYVDKQSRNESGPVVSGRGAAMAAAASSTDQCHRCKAYGHFQRDCPKTKSIGRLLETVDRRELAPVVHLPDELKLRGLGQTREHDVELELRTNKQKELQGLAANLALLQSAAHAGFSNPGSAHLVQSSPAAVAPTHLVQSFPAAAAAAPAPLAQSSPAAAAPAPTEPTSFGFSFSALNTSLPETGSKPAASPSPPQDNRLPSGFFGAFMATPAELSLAPFRSDGSSIRMVVDSGATGNYLDPALTPGLRSHMRDVEDLRMTAANDRHSLRVVLVPGLGTNLFSVTAAMLNGVASLFYPTCPMLESEDVVIPMQSHGVDGSTGKLVCSIQVRLRAGAADLNAPAALALKAESALEQRACEGRLVGYSTDSKSYRVYNAETRRVRTEKALPHLGEKTVSELQVGAARSDCHFDHGSGAGCCVGLGDEGARGLTKHIALRFFFIRELVSEGKISVNYIPTDSNPADIGTKHLNKHRFKHLMEIIRNFNVDDFIRSKFN